MEPTIPTVAQLLWPTVTAMRALGGSAHITEISEWVIVSEDYSEEQQAASQPGKSMSKIDYRLHWARTHLKNIGVLESSARGVWALTQLGMVVGEDEIADRVRAWKREERAKRQAHTEANEAVDPAEQEEDDPPDLDLESAWRSELLDALLAMTPEAFERLCQRLLREAGFRDVEVTPPGPDGGIDGVGVYRPSLVSFPVYFQCKRHRSSVRASHVRDFRGAMEGRGEKGLLIATGTFTRDAREESTRTGATTIDLIDGEDLCDLLKQYGLGVSTTQRLTEDVLVDPDFFDRF